jgi:SAM-dependent methyltransferase
MTTDVFTDFKAKQREGWAHFAPIEVHTTRPAAQLVRNAQIRAGQNVLDVGCGTGVATITACRLGAKTTGLDLTPELLERARENAAIGGFDNITWKEGDVEDLPFRDGEFDVVISQWGHMFAPQPELALREMLRVLKPNGTIAFATWPPESSIGQMFGLLGKYMPPPPGAAVSVGRSRYRASTPRQRREERSILPRHRRVHCDQSAALPPQHELHLSALYRASGVAAI